MTVNKKKDCVTIVTNQDMNQMIVLIQNKIPTNNAPSFKRPSGRASGTTCYKCGGPNHFARDCQANTVKCYACGKVGHISKDCHSSAGGSNFSAKTCYNCGKSGHISKECTA